jgi:hypothetical protein
LVSISAGEAGVLRRKEGRTWGGLHHMVALGPKALDRCLMRIWGPRWLISSEYPWERLAASPRELSLSTSVSEKRAGHVPALAVLTQNGSPGKESDSVLPAEPRFQEKASALRFQWHPALLPAPAGWDRQVGWPPHSFLTTLTYFPEWGSLIAS